MSPQIKELTVKQIGNCIRMDNIEKSGPSYRLIPPSNPSSLVKYCQTV